MQEDRQSPCPVEFSTLVPGGAADKASPALGAGQPVVAIWSAASRTRNSKASPALGAGRPVVAIWSAASFARICFKLALL